MNEPQDLRKPLYVLSTPRERGLSIDDAEQKVLDFFGGVSQQDIASGAVDPSTLSRADKIGLLIDGTTSGAFGGSPWSIGQTLDASVANQIHAQSGGTLVFAVDSSVAQALLDKALPPVRYALVWDDSIVASQGTLDVPAIGQGALVATVANEPTGQSLTLWLTDQFVRVHLVQQDSLANAAKVQSSINAKLGAAADSNPVADALNKVGEFFTISQAGGLVALAVVGVVLVLIVRSESFKDTVKVVAKAV